MKPEDHERARDLIAAGVTQGLDDEARGELDAHLAQCTECRNEQRRVNQLDANLLQLFAPYRPAESFDEGAIWSFRLRSATIPSSRFQWVPKKLLAGVAATLALGVVGFGASRVVSQGNLSFPGDDGSGQLLAFLPETITEFFDRETSTLFEEEYLSPKFSIDSPSASKVTEERLAESINSDRTRQLYRYSEAEAFRRGVPGGESQPLNGPVPSTPPVSIGSSPPPTDPTRAYFGRAIQPALPPASGLNLNARTEQEGGKLTEGLKYSYFAPQEARPSLSLSPTDPSAQPSRPLPELSLKREPALGDSRSDRDKALGANQHRELNETLGFVLVPENQPGKQADAQQGLQRKIVIRTGEMSFEIQSFDAAVATITKLISNAKGAFIATINSEKLPNGKVQGSVVVRVPPALLDALILDLRSQLGSMGELKGQRIGSEDVSKQFTDLESRLKAARTMETRLLEIIKSGKGEIKQLLEAEKELGVWRTKIEELEGEIRFLDNRVSLSTLTITLNEKEIRSAATMVETERVDAGIEVEDVDPTYQALLKTIAEFKGRVAKAEVKQLSAGQFNATIQFEMTPSKSGEMRDRLRQLGTVARLEIQRTQQPKDGSPDRDAKIVQGDTVFLVQLYNLANVSPRETVTQQLAVVDVPESYQALRTALLKSSSRVLSAQLNEQDRQNVVAMIDFEVRRSDQAAVMELLQSTGEVASRSIIRSPDQANVTDSKILYRVTLISALRVTPRETTSLTVEVADVDAAIAILKSQANDISARLKDSQMTRLPDGRVQAKLVYDLPLSSSSGLVESAKAAGILRAQQTSRDVQALEGKFALARVELSLTSGEQIVPKDAGLWQQIRKGLSYSATALLMSLSWIIFGLCVVVPWAIVGYGGYRLLRRLFRKPNQASLS